MSLRENLRLYAVTLPSPALMEQISRAIQGGATIIQLREKGKSTDEIVRLGAPIVTLCREKHIPCLIDDDILAAKELGADGVHLGQSDGTVSSAREILGKNALIGVSAHSVAEAVKAYQDGADYLGCGAVFATNTKRDTTPLARETLAQICRAVPLPVVAIGGITAQNALSLHGTGISGIAVSSAIFRSSDIASSARQLRDIADKIAQSGGNA